MMVNARRDSYNWRKAFPQFCCNFVNVFNSVLIFPNVPFQFLFYCIMLFD